MRRNICDRLQSPLPTNKTNSEQKGGTAKKNYIKIGERENIEGQKLESLNVHGLEDFAAKTSNKKAHT